MAACVACDRPLICDDCGEGFEPASEAQYRAFFWREMPVLCPRCGAILVCHWCKTIYDGLGDDPAEFGPD